MLKSHVKQLSLKKRKLERKKNWVDTEVRDLKKTVITLGNKLILQPFNGQVKLAFFKHSKDLKKMVKRKKYLYKKAIYDKLLNWRESDPKAYWQFLNSLKNDNIDKNRDTCIPTDFNNLAKHTDKPFTSSEINKCIKKLKVGKSTGPDLISNEILTQSNLLTNKAITKLFNLILDSGKYPDNWRKSFTILIFKSGEKTDLNNYRGISLQNCLAKLFSSTLNERLILHYENLFANQQFGFRGNHRTSDSIFILKTLITKYIYGEKGRIFSCFVDLRRAFDSLWQNGLLYKLEVNNTGQKFHKVIRDMYSSSYSAVKIDNEYTYFFELNRGVKQGDSLSPTLFNCYINDLHNIFDDSCDPLKLDMSNISSLSFADDLVILSKSHQGLQNALKKLESYCYKWQLTVNTKKTKTMTFQKSDAYTPILYYKDVPLVETKEYNFLGNIIDFKGNFKRAAQELSKKAMKVLFTLKSRFTDFHSIPIDLSCKLFDTLIRPVLLYNCEIWFMDEYLSIFRSLNRSNRNGTSFDILALEDKLLFEKVHHKFCKSVLGIKKTACNIAAKSELGRVPLTSVIKTQVLMYFIRINLNDINPLVKEAFNVNKTLHNSGKYSWYTFACSIAEENNINLSEYHSDRTFNQIKKNLKHKLKTEIIHNYKTKTLDKLSKVTDESKLFLYSHLKSDINLEENLSQNNSFKNRQILTKFRLSDHGLKIEIGRYQNIPRDQRLCNICSEIDNENHFFL